MKNARLDEAQAGIKTARRNINNLRYADDTTLTEEKWRGAKEPLDKSEKAGLNLNIKKKSRIMALSSIISWQTDGEAMETVTEFIFLGSKSLWMVTAVMKLKDNCFSERMLRQN